MNRWETAFERTKENWKNLKEEVEKLEDLELKNESFIFEVARFKKVFNYTDNLLVFWLLRKRYYKEYDIIGFILEKNDDKEKTKKTFYS